ncbi:MAG: CHRD domain-containing protein [Gammaproteobacteria bacterium]|nr:CHRD domain-containing protein [Gammaproteobacteria bacterium]MDH5303525.1 CHRD domain-containing protein [Gammaproteobacteria bacterium]MDH5321867.1 CHRD domain-containing protein [Gammaproteobacteria bacterium]
MTIQRSLSHKVLAVFTLLLLAACGGGNSGGKKPPTPPVDTTAPVVNAVQAPAANVNRTVTLTVTATDSVGVTAVRFFVDGVLLGTDTTAPYSIAWDTSAATEGDHTLTAEAQDAAGNIGTSAAAIVTVQNVLVFAVSLSGDEEMPVSGSTATAQANLTINVASGAVQGAVTTSGMTATAAHIHNAFAGTNGPVLIPLAQDAVDPNLFAVAGGAMLDAAGVERLLAGALYVNVHSATSPAGEIRGQILPDGFVLRFSDLNGANRVPQIDTLASGRAAVTLDTAGGAIVVHAQVNGLDDATQAHVHQAYAGANGPVLVGLVKDAGNPGHWSVEGAVLNAAGLTAFDNGQLYVNVHSPAYPGGEIRGQLLPEGIVVLFAELSSAQEVPRFDSNADGLATLTLDEAGLSLTVHVNTRNLADASAAHLHSAFGGVNGPVAIGLTQDGGNPAHWFVEQQVLSAAQLTAILAGGTYINVHNPAHPGGAIRGQVIPEGIVFATGLLDGSQRVPAIATSASGTYAVTADPAAGTVVAHINTVGVDDATAAHLHDGYAGTNGGVTIGLTQDPANVARWSAVNAPVNAAQLAALGAGQYYVNVHTPAYPGGEIRGQVIPSPIEVLFTGMSGGQEVPANASAASAIAASTVDLATGTITLHVNATGVDDATASHIHLGFAGTNGGVQIGLSKDAGNPGHWSVVGAQLDAARMMSYQDGQLYVNLHTPAFPGGEIRGQIAPPPVEVLFTGMSGAEEVPAVATAATGIAASTMNRDTGVLTLHVRATGVDQATASHIHTAAAGQNGPVLVPLTQDAGNLGHWSASAALDAASLGDYKAGGLYVNVHTPTNPGGEIRGQIIPPDAADFDNIEPTVTLASPGSPVSGTVTLTADASDNQGVSLVRFLVNGAVIGSDSTAPYSLDWVTTTAANGDVTLTAEAEDATGNIGVSADVIVTVQNAAAVTLAQIQASVFTPVCSGCHSGPTGNVLPSGMNLSNANASFNALVNVASLQVALDRVEPGNPDNSYLIRKLEGGPNIVLNRMPQGGPFLDQATIDMVRQWISDGAPNN